MRNNRLLNYLIAIYLARFIMPLLSVLIPAGVIIILALVIILMLLHHNEVLAKTKDLVIIYILGFVLYVVPKFVVRGISVLTVYEFINALVLPSIIAFYYISKGDRKSIAFIKKVIIASLFVTCITTYLGNQLMPGASRMMATGMEDNPELLQSYYRYNIGGFDFVYIIVLIVPYLVYRIKTKRGGERFFNVIFLISIFATVVIASYTTALLCTILGLMAFFMPVGLKTKGVIRYLLLGLVIVLVSRGILPFLLDGLAATLNNDEITMRLNDLSNVISGNEYETGSDMEARQELYNNEWDNFISSPIIGVFKFGGGHSFLLGILSFFGMVGALLTTILLKQFYDKFFKIFSRDNIYGNLLYIFVIYIILLALNPRCYFMVPAFIIPFLAFEDRLENRIVKY